MKQSNQIKNDNKTNVSNKNVTNKNNKLKKAKNFWRFFWITIVLLAFLFIGLNIIASKKNDVFIKQNKKAKLESIVIEFQKKFPEYTNIIQGLTQESKRKIHNKIDENIDIAYNPLYKRIDTFSNFHYSVTGEYTELLTAVFGKIDNILKHNLFEPANFNQSLKSALEQINNESTSILKDQLSNMKKKIQNSINISDNEVNFLFNKIIKITQIDLQKST